MEGSASASPASASAPTTAPAEASSRQVVLSAEETAALTLRANEAFDREDYVACLPLRQQLLAATLERPEASLQEKVDAHIALARVYATSSHHFKEMTKQFQEAVELASRANDVPVIAKTLTRLAFTLFRALQPDAALTQFQNAIQLAQTIKEQDKGESYYYALIEFGRAVLNINAEGGQAKAAKALVEAVDGTRAAQGEYSELHALALLALGEAKKAAEDYDGCIELIEKALTTKKLPPLDHSRALCFLGSAYSEKPGQAQKSLECYLEAIALRTTLCANGAENMMVAEVYLDVAAEHYELGQQLKTVEALEKCIPFLSLPDHVVDVQFAWLRKALEAAQLSEDEAQERYRRIKQTRKTAQAAKRRLAGPVKDKAAVANSFLPAVKLPPKKKQQGGKKK